MWIPQNCPFFLPFLTVIAFHHVKRPPLIIGIADRIKIISEQLFPFSESLHLLLHSGNSFYKLPIFLLLSVTCRKHSACSLPTKLSVFLSPFLIFLSLQDDLSQVLISLHWPKYFGFCFFKKNNLLRVQKNNTLNLECKDVRDQFLENLNFAIHFL